MSSLLTRIAILALAAALVLWPAVAQAGDSILGTVGDLEYRSDTTPSVGAPSVDTTDVECGGGFPYVLGGGTMMNGFNVETHIAGSGPIDFDLDADATPDNGWRGTIANDSGDPKDLTTFAVCSTREPALKMKATTIPAKGDPPTGTVTAKCAKKAHATGGGFLIGTGNTSMVHAIEDRPWDSDDRRKAPDDGWRVRAFNNTGAAAELTAYVMCIRGGGLSYPKQAGAYDMPLGFDLRCPEEANVTGGGMKISGPADEAYINASNPYDDKDDVDSIPNNGWSTAGATLNGRKKYTGYAVCYEAP